MSIGEVGTPPEIVLAVALIAAVPPSASAQALADVRTMFDAGQYQQAVDAAAASQDPHVMFLVAQSQQKLRRPDDARKIYQQLAARPAADAWQSIGKSAVALLSSNAAGAAQEADQAVARGGSIAEGHYVRGLALSAQIHREAAAAFQKATESARTGRPRTTTPASRFRRQSGPIRRPRISDVHGSRRRLSVKCVDSERSGASETKTSARSR